MSKLLVKYDIDQAIMIFSTEWVIDGHLILIDREDIHYILDHKWQVKYSHSTPYIIRKTTIGGEKKTLRLHRVIMNTPKGYDCHHRNKNTLDVRKTNLVNCTKQEHRIIQKTLF